MTWVSKWPIDGSVPFARNAWFSLSDDERTACIERSPAYVAWAAKDDLTAPAVYLKNRSWTELPEQALVEPVQTRGIAKVCGKLWMGTRFDALSKEPTGRIIVTSFDEVRIEKKQITREQLLREKRRDNGWPVVNAMRDHANRREPYTTSLALLPFVQDFRQVHRDSDVFAAWKRLHERNGWPFIEHPPEWVYLPPLDGGADDLEAAVDAALSNFLFSINEGRSNDA